MLTVNRPKWPVLRVLALVMMVTAAIAIPTDTSASHNFSDVPTSLIFHEEVSRIADAGITTGCGGGKYCPFDPVSRLAMAAFMNRGFGRVAMDNTLIQDTVSSVDFFVPIGEITIDVPGAGGSAKQFVEVRGQVVVEDTFSTCPCFVFADVFDPTNELLDPADSVYDLVGLVETVNVSWVFEASPTGPHTYQMWLGTSDAALDLTLSDLVLTATTYPFGADGGSVLSPASVAEATSLDAATSRERRPIDAPERLPSRKP